MLRSLLPLLLLAPVLHGQSCEVSMPAQPNGGISLVGDRLLIGASSGTSGISGFVEEYTLSTDGSLTLMGTTGSPAPQPNDLFGAAIHSDGQRMIVGAPAADLTVGSEGFAFVFARQGNSWVWEQTLLAPSAQPNGRFGTSVFVEGNLAIVGEPGTPNWQNPGAVHIFRIDQGAWIWEASLEPTAGNPGDQFGASLDYLGGRLVVGAPRYDGQVLDSGAVFTYGESSGWGQWNRLLPPLPAIGAEFGRGVALSDGRLVVGAPEDSTLADRAGRAYLYWWSGSGYGGPSNLDPLVPTVLGRYGWYVDAHDGAYAVAKRTHTGQSKVELWGSNPCAGLARGRSFDLAGQTGTLRGVALGDGLLATTHGTGLVGLGLDCTLGEVICSFNTQGSNGLSARLSATGSLIAADDDLWLQLDQLPPGEFGLALVSPNAGFIPPPGGCSTMLCLQSPIGRFNSQVQLSGPDGRASLQVPLGLLPAPIAAPVLPGETWHFQYWTRDTGLQFPLPYFTNALSVTFE